MLGARPATFRRRHTLPHVQEALDYTRAVLIAGARQAEEHPGLNYSGRPSNGPNSPR